MDVRLPDGTVVRGVPDGMSKADFITAARRNGYNVPDDTPAPPAAPVETSEPKPFTEPSTGFFQSHPQGGVDFAQGILATPGRLMKSVAQIAGMENTPEWLDMASKTPDNGYGTAGAIAGDIGATLALPFGAVSKLAEVPNVVAKVPALARTMQARGFLPGAARTADVAATQAGLGAVLSPDHQAEGAAWGAAGGVGGQALGRAMGGIIKPTDEARVLMDAGVTVTPGQAAGKGSFTKWAEEQLSSLPIASHFVRSAQNRAVGEANRAAAQAVVDVPNLVTEKVSLGMPPREAIEKTRETIGDAYSNALSGMDVPSFFPHAALQNRLSTLPADFPLLPARDFRNMERFVNVRMADLAKQSGGKITGDQLKQLDSELGQHVRNLYSSTNAADKTAAPAWAELQAQIREVMEFAQADPAKQQQLQAANNAYRQLLALERAMLPGAEQFTPRQLARQVKNMKLDNTELGNVSRAMTATLPNMVPNSGTPERLLMAGMPAMLGIGGAGASNMGYDTLGAGMMTAGALGSRPGARFMTGGYGLQEALAQALRRATPAITRNLNNGNDR